MHFFSYTTRMSEKMHGPRGEKRRYSSPKGSSPINQRRKETAAEVVHEHSRFTSKMLLPLVNQRLQERGLEPYSPGNFDQIVSEVRRRDRSTRKDVKQERLHYLRKLRRRTPEGEKRIQEERANEEYRNALADEMNRKRSPNRSGFLKN